MSSKFSDEDPHEHDSDIDADSTYSHVPSIEEEMDSGDDIGAVRAADAEAYTDGDGDRHGDEVRDEDEDEEAVSASYRDGNQLSLHDDHYDVNTTGRSELTAAAAAAASSSSFSPSSAPSSFSPSPSPSSSSSSSSHHSSSRRSSLLHPPDSSSLEIPPASRSTSAPVGETGREGGIKKSRSTDLIRAKLEEQVVKLDAAIRDIKEVGPQVEDALLETLDYDNHEDTATELSMESAKLHSKVMLLMTVFMTVLIAFVTAMLMYCVSHSVDFLLQSKFTLLQQLISSNPAAAYFAYVFINCGLTAVASSMVSILAPYARGGGVPYAMAYLNGTNTLDHFSFRVVIVKVVALAFTISGGLTMGMEEGEKERESGEGDRQDKR